MSLFFYECQQAGNLPEWNRVEWRADATTIDEIDGGWYDAGDHVKFNLPMAYSASMLAWGLYQYPEGIEACGEMTNYLNNLKYVLDYLAACDHGDSAVFQVGNGTTDHTWWGPVELYQYGMEDSGTSYEAARETLEASEGCSAVFGGMAAALAAGACALQKVEANTVQSDYIVHAKNLFQLADASKSDAYYNDSNASGFYRSSHFYDELFYAANWLYIATGEQSYLDQAASYIPHLDKELGSDELKYTWGHCWDDTMQGGMLLYAINTQDPTYIARVQKHVDYWTNTVDVLPGGMRWVTTWGCARYAQTAAFIAAVACDTVLEETVAYREFYESQVNFVLGENPDGQSYVVGYGEKYPRNAHHRTAHASWKNDLAIPDENRHILYGALVGGPSQDGSYEDDRGNYINNEVATDYNAGFTAILCKMIDQYGGKSDPNFPPKEAHDGPEFYVEAMAKTLSDSGVTISFKLTNHSAWPARVQDHLSFRYYMDLTEVLDAGFSASDVTVRCDRDQSAMYAAKGVQQAEISALQHDSGNIYYVEVTFPDGRAVLPVSEGMQQCEILLALVYPNYGSGWDASNDFSNKDLLTSEDSVISKYIPVYVNGALYYGVQPDGKEADGLGEIGGGGSQQTTTTAQTTVPVSEGKRGDVDCNGFVELADAILLCRYNAEDAAITVTTQGLQNAECDDDGILTSSDVTIILRYLAKLIDHI